MISFLNYAIILFEKMFVKEIHFNVIFVFLNGIYFVFSFGCSLFRDEFISSFILISKNYSLLFKIKCTMNELT